MYCVTMLAVFCLIASVLFLQITVDKNPLVHISPADQNQTLPDTDEALISETQKETEYTGSDLPSRFHENKFKVNTNERSKPNSVSEYLKVAHQAVASDDKEGAVEAYESALELKPSLYKVRTDLGDLLISLGRITEAKASYLKAIETEENYAVAWNKLGMVHYMERDGQAAVEHFLKAVNLDKNYLEGYANLGNILKEAKNYEAAINVYMQALKLNPNHPTILANLGWIYYDQENFDLAIKTMHKAIELQPNILDVHCNLGAAYQKKGKLKEAEKAYIKGLERQPDQWCLLNNLAILKQNTGAPHKAVELYERALKALPDYPDAHFNLANTLHQQGKYYEAAQHYKEAIRIQPSFPNIKHVGNALLDIGNKLMSSDHNKAAECFNAVLKIDPTAAIAHGQLGVIYQDKNEIEKAIESYKTALQYKPDFSDHVFAKLEHVLEMVCDWTDYDGRMKRLVGIIQKQLERHDMDLAVHALHSLVYPISHEQRKGIAVIHAERCLQKVSHLPKRNYIYPKTLSPSGRLRIGYVSSDFRDHAMFHLFQSVPRLHDRKKVEIFCYSLSPDDGSRFRENFVRECEHFSDLSKITCHGEAADIISAHGIHILINMNGYITSARNEIFALRPAPIQAMYLAYPGTSGADYIDYIITDRISSPLEFASQFTEKVAYMPKTHFLGDHRQMFPHMVEKVVLAPESMPLENVRDNVVLLNGMDLSSVLENMNIEKVYLAADNTTATGKPVKTFSLTVAQLTSMDPIDQMIRSNDYQTVLDGVFVRNGLIVNQLNIRTGTGEEVPQEIFVTTRQQYGLPDDAIVFCNFQQLYKIHPPVLKVWANILKRVPNSVLWVLRFPAAAEKNMIKNFRALGISSNRIVFSKTIGKEENLRRAQLADVALDTFLYNGHTTGMDMLWAGNPVVTLPGETLASRIAASQLTTLGCPELIASSPEDYENIAVKLGTDHKYLQRMRAKVQTRRLESPLFNITIYTRDMERLLARIWKRHESGKKPDHITEWNDE